MIIFASGPYPLASSLWCPGAYGLRGPEPGPLSLDDFEALASGELDPRTGVTSRAIRTTDSTINSLPSDQFSSEMSIRRPKVRCPLELPGPLLPGLRPADAGVDDDPPVVAGQQVGVHMTRPRLLFPSACLLVSVAQSQRGRAIRP